MFPTAWLTCCSLGSDVVQGVTRQDGAHEQLSLEDLGRCFGARDILIENAVRLLLRTFSPPLSAQRYDPYTGVIRLKDMSSKLQYDVEAVSHPDFVRRV
ncbi:hypothetical protein BV20DRAFT_57146 [Pilatotrama ljubarskyi]|nr:hypothetical protein BV20DRAFT_57146 [Pilatotrama ljubarskyi]